CPGSQYDRKPRAAMSAYVEPFHLLLIIQDHRFIDHSGKNKTMPICDNLSRKHRPFFCEKTWQNRGIYTKNKSGEIEKWKGGVHGTKRQQITHNIRPKPQKSSSKAKKFILPGTAPENSLASWQNARTRPHRPRLPASAGKGPPSKCRPVCDKTRKNRKEKGSPPHLKPFRPPLQQETAAPKTVPVTTQRK